MTSDSVPVWPRIEAVTRPDGTGGLTIDGTSHTIHAPTVEEARQRILARIAGTAAELGRPVHALASGPDGQWPLIVHPDGRVEDDDSRPAWAIAPIVSAPSASAPETESMDEATTPRLPAIDAVDEATTPRLPAIDAVDEATTPRLPVTDAAEPSVEKPESDPWASAAREAQVSQAAAEPRSTTEPSPSNPPTSDLPTFFDLPDDDTVVRVHREEGDTTPAPVQPAAPSRRRLVLLTAAAVGAVVLVAAGTVAVIALTGNRPETGPDTSALPGAGANLPAQAPAGYDQTALWSVPVGSEPQILLTPDGGVLAAPAGDDKITVFDQDTGTEVWEGRGPVDDLHLSRVGDGPVLAADSPGILHLWPLDATDPAGVAPTTIELGSDQAEVTYDGAAPLIVLPDQTVALLDGKGAALVRRDVPAGATPVAATPQHVIAVGPDAWWTITADADPVRHKLLKPERAVGDPSAAIAVGGDQLAVAWRTEDSAKDVIALVGLKRNAIRATGLIRSSAFPPDAEPLRDRAGSTRTIGPVLLDVGPKPVIADLGDITPEAVIGRTVYGTSENKPAVATWSPDGVDLEVAESPGERAPIEALTKDVAFVVASEADETFLYALPRIEAP